jgi:exopolyphosphatase/guanosine-5'-triphosphate,3'-diphosphate pyrophosphatase
MSESSQTLRVGAIDAGTNSLRLLVADVTPSGQLVDVTRRMEITRLGEGVDRTGSIAPAALARTLAVCRDYGSVLDQLDVHHVRFVATSASRDARNGDELRAGVQATLGVSPEVIDGQEEAALSFLGATAELMRAGQPGPFLVVDLGGGSTELALGQSTLEVARSVNVGCVRITERHLLDDPPTSAQVAAATADVDGALTPAMADLGVLGAGERLQLIGVAGTFTTIAAVTLGLPSYDPARIHLAQLPAGEVRATCQMLLAATRAQRAALPPMHPGRVEVMRAGALIVDRALSLIGAPRLTVSEHDILDGIALTLARQVLSGGRTEEGDVRG